MMHHTDERSPYCRFQGKEIILRDELAIDRTVLANERTFLAYVRTALAMLVIGATFFQLFTAPLLLLCGFAFIVLGLVLLITGTARFFQQRRDLDMVRRTTQRGE
jgi:putative membrane protein